MQSQIGPALQEVGQVHESVQTQSIVPIVRQMSHEDTDLQNRRKGVSRYLPFLFYMYVVCLYIYIFFTNVNRQESLRNVNQLHIDFFLGHCVFGWVGI